MLKALNETVGRKQYFKGKPKEKVNLKMIPDLASRIEGFGWPPKQETGKIISENKGFA
jgi:hypothetical protein